jgi:hypothetical protein
MVEQNFPSHGSQEACSEERVRDKECHSNKHLGDHFPPAGPTSWFSPSPLMPSHYKSINVLFH